MGDDVVQVYVVRDFVGNHRPGLIQRQDLLPEEDHNIDEDQQNGDNGKRAGRLVVSQGNHKINLGPLLLGRAARNFFLTAAPAGRYTIPDAARFHTCRFRRSAPAVRRGKRNRVMKRLFIKRLLLCLGALCLLAIGVAAIVLLVLQQRQAQTMRQFIAAGPAALAREEAAARQAGVPLDPAQLQQPLPPPGQNAAPLYIKLTQLLHDKPLGLPKYGEGMDAFHSYTPAQIASVRQTLASRRDVMTLVHQAADKPQCVFARDWSNGLEMEFPEYQTQREAARLLETESYLMAKNGNYQKAIANQALGFRVAKHAASDHVIISYLVGTASDALTFAGMRSILEQAGPNADVNDAVRTTVTAQYSRLPLRDAMAGEAGYVCTLFTRMHQAEKYGLQAALDFGYPSADNLRPTPHPVQVSPAEQKRVHNLIDAWKADYLAGMLPLVCASNEPVTARRAVFAALDQRFEKPPGLFNPTVSTHLLSSLLLPAFSKIDEDDTKMQAHEAVIVAAAAFLSEKAKIGTYPDQLPPGFTDPYTDKPLQYRREGDSGFVVYSVGPSGHFDGGRPGEKAPGQESLFRYPVQEPSPAL